MIQKTIQIGNSVGIIIPKNVPEEHEINVGDKNHVDVKPIKKSAYDVDAKFMKMTDEFIEEHKDVLQAHAKR